MTTHGDRVRANIIATGLRLWPQTSARAIGRALDMSHMNVLYHFNGGDGLQAAIAAAAIEQRNSRIIRQLIANDDPAIASLSAIERFEYMAAN